MTTHTINRPLFDTPKTALGAALADALTSLDNGEAPELPEADVPVTASLTEILSEPTPTVRFNLLNSFLSSINLMLMSQCRQSMLREGTQPPADAPSIDTRNEGDDKSGINDRGYNDKSRAYAGNKVEMPPSQIAKRLAAIRAYAIDQQARVHTGLTAFVPRPLSESIDFMRSQLPQTSSKDDLGLRAIVEATGLTIEQCMAMRDQVMKEDLESLNKMAPEMVATGDALTHKANIDTAFIEQCFDELPPVTQVNVFIAATNSLVSAHKTIFKRILRRGDASLAGDMVIAKAMHVRGRAYLSQLAAKHQSELADFESRGNTLKEVKAL